MSLANDYLDFMLLIFNADEYIDKNEIGLFIGMLDQIGINQKLKNHYRSILTGKKPYPQNKPTIKRIVKERSSEEIGFIVRDAYLMADADGSISEFETEVIKILLSKSNIPKSRFKNIHNWGIEYVEHSKRMNKLFSPKRTK